MHLSKESRDSARVGILGPPRVVLGHAPFVDLLKEGSWL